MAWTPARWAAPRWYADRWFAGSSVELYPSSATVPRKTKVRRLPNQDVDIAEDGTVRGTNLSRKPAYRINVNHPYITSSELATLRAFFDKFKNSTVKIEDAEGRIYSVLLTDDLDEKTEESASYCSVRVLLTGNLAE